VDVTTKTGLHLLARYVTPGEIRAAGRARVLAHLRKLRHVKDAHLTALADAAVAAAQPSRSACPARLWPPG